MLLTNFFLHFQIVCQIGGDGIAVTAPLRSEHGQGAGGQKMGVGFVGWTERSGHVRRK